MAKLLISYDLIQGKNYKRLTDELTNSGGCRALLSVWMISLNSTAAQARDHFSKFVDSDDRLIVVECTGSAAWTGSLPQAQKECMRSVLQG